jgi:hypothetical protein
MPIADGGVFWAIARSRSVSDRRREAQRNHAIAPKGQRVRVCEAVAAEGEKASRREAIATF